VAEVTARAGQNSRVAGATGEFAVVQAVRDPGGIAEYGRSAVTEAMSQSPYRVPAGSVPPPVQPVKLWVGVRVQGFGGADGGARCR
jgi:hypothetical protein